MNILLVCEESAGIRVLRALAAAGEHDLRVVATPGGTRTGAGVHATALALGIEVHDSARVADPAFAEAVRSWNVDILLNVHSLRVLPAAVIEAPAIGSFNLHPAPLPEYAGLNCPSWSIYNGERIHGVTVHWMTARIDAGPIAYRSMFEVGESETGFTLSARCIRDGVPLLLELVETAAHDPGAVPHEPQDVSQRRYYRAGPPQAGWLDWEDRASRIAAFVRAADYTPFPSPWGFPRAAADQLELRVCGCRVDGGAPAGTAPGTVGDPEGEAARVACGDGWVLVERVEVDGVRVPGAEVLRPRTRLRSPFAPIEKAPGG